MKEINARQSLVAFFCQRAHFRADICEVLKEVDDVGRLCQRFLLGRADFGDLVAINKSIETWSTLKKNCEHERSMEVSEQRSPIHQIEWESLESVFDRMTDLSELSDKISKAVICNANDANEIALGEETASNSTETDVPEAESLNPDKSPKKWSINPKYVFTE